MPSNVGKSAVFLLTLAAASAQASTPRSLAEASLEELLDIQVTSVSKKEQSLAKTGAAVFVINQEDIRRSGATSIPELLRMAPGLDVAQIDSNQWAVSIRGFNALYSNKVLVLIDGRTLYVDSFSGVFWDQVDVPLEDIDRIEIIRGPGGTVWGANAVNGVINIITQSSADTKGGLVTAGTGSRETAEGLAQYGGNAGSGGAYRVFARYFNVNNSAYPGGSTAADGWHSSQAGFRSDLSPTSRDTLSFQGGVIATGGGATSSVVNTAQRALVNVNNPLLNTSGYVLGRWVHTLANGSETSLQIYDNLMGRQESRVRVANNTLDVEFQHHLTAGPRHDIVWGVDYRYSHDRLSQVTSDALQVIPNVKEDNLTTAFLQDEIRISRSVSLTLGAKFEHNSYTGFEFEPSVQLVWTATDRHSLWASASRAIRQPDHLDDGVLFNVGIIPVPGMGSALETVNGNTNVVAEHLNDYEAGYRGQATRRLSVDVTAFLSYYSRLQSDEPENPFITLSAGTPLLVLPFKFGNLGRATDFGMEIFANWNVNSSWRISPGYSFLEMKSGIDPGSQDMSNALIPGNSPRHQPQIRSLLNLRKNVELDTSLKFVSRLSSQNVPGYVRLDARLGWRPGEKIEFSIVGQDLATPRHIEFVDITGFFVGTEVQRSVFGKITWRF
jgi:iron complex outermembrane receptor protein